MRVVGTTLKWPWFGVGAIVVLYTLLALAVTWPFVLHPATTTIAPPGGDLYGSTAKCESLSHGPVDNAGVARVSVFSTLFLWLGTRLVGAIPAHAFLSLCGMILTATV